MLLANACLSREEFILRFSWSVKFSRNSNFSRNHYFSFSFFLQLSQLAKFYWLGKFMILDNCYLLFSQTCFLIQVVMKFSIPAAPQNYPESADFKPLPFLGDGDMNVMRREIHCYYPMRDYGYLEELLERNHSDKWVQTFQGKGSSFART